MPAPPAPETSVGSRSDSNGLADGELSEPPTVPGGGIWVTLLKSYGFPTLVAFGLAWGFVTYHNQARADLAYASKLARDERKERDTILSTKLEALAQEHRTGNKILEQIRDDLRRHDGAGVGVDREAPPRRARGRR